jgi:alkylation response protein AidB-like acyl-CoA dehydrogenase
MTATRETTYADRARELAPLLTRMSDKIDDARQLPDDVVAALHEARLYRMLLPRSCGGAELDVTGFLLAVEELAKADASTAWCVGQAGGCAMAGAYLDPPIAGEIFGAPTAVLAWGPSARNTKAVAVDGGYRVTGTWIFASGSRHAAWLGGHAAVVEGDGRPRLVDGKPLERTMLFPRAKATITDVWQVVGLRGTGSDTYAVADLFVPEAYTFTRESQNDRREAGPLYVFTTFHVFGIAFAGVALGIARATLDAFIELAGQKTPTLSTKPLRESTMVQTDLALAEARLRSSRAFLLETLGELWTSAATARGFTLDQRGRLRLATTYAMHQARHAVDIVYHAAGATAIFDANPFERRFRDMHTVSQQVQGHASNFALAGEIFLGLPPSSKIV